MKPLTAKQSVFVLLALLAALALAFAACGGGGKGGGKTPTPTGGDDETPEATATTDAGSGQDGATATVNETVWHTGWKITIGQASYLLGDFGSAQVDIEATFENLGEVGRFDAQLVLESGGQS